MSARRCTAPDCLPSAPRATWSGEVGAKGLREAVRIRTCLREAIEAGGSSLRDHRQADGSLGYFQHNFRVYDRDRSGLLESRLSRDSRRADAKWPLDLLLSEMPKLIRKDSFWHRRIGLRRMLKSWASHANAPSDELFGSSISGRSYRVALKRIGVGPPLHPARPRRDAATSS